MIRYMYDCDETILSVFPEIPLADTSNAVMEFVDAWRFQKDIPRHGVILSKETIGSLFFILY